MKLMKRYALAALVAVGLLASNWLTVRVVTQNLGGSTPIGANQVVGCFIRSLFAGSSSDATTSIGVLCNPRGDHLVTQALPERSELVRMGSSWEAIVPTGSAAAPVAAWPTTACALVVYNGESVGGKVYLIDRVWIAYITSQTAAQNFGFIVENIPNVPAPTVPTDNAAVLRVSMSGNRSNYNGKAAIALGTTTATANKWVPLGTPYNTVATTNLMAYLTSETYGRYIVPPGGAFCLQYIAAAATGTAIGGIAWHEVILPVSSL